MRKSADGDVSSAVLGLQAALATRCLPVPPIHAQLLNSVEALGPEQWGTENFNPREHYLFWQHARELVTRTDRRPCFLFSYWGHGLNSYAFTLTASVGPLTLAVQSHWVDWQIYNDPAVDAGRLADIFQRARILILAAEVLPRPPRLLLLDTFRALHGNKCLIDLMTDQELPMSPRAAGPGRVGQANATTEFANSALLFSEAMRQVRQHST
jgi:hypothetical protein